MAKAGKDVVEGIGSGVASTLEGVYNLAKRAMSGTTPAGPFSVLPEAPQWLQKAAAPTQYDAQGNPVESSTSFKVGRTGEQIGEFFVPSGAIADAAEGAAKLGARVGSKTAVAARAITRAGAEAASAGAVTGLQTGGDTAAMKKAALTAGVTSGVFSTIGEALRATAPSLYKVGLKFPSRIGREQVGEVIDDAIANKITNPEEAKKLLDARDAITDDLIQNSGRSQAPISLSVAEDALTEMRDLANRIGDPKMLSKINKRWDSLMEAHGAKPAFPGTPPSTSTSPIVSASGQPIVHITPGLPPIPAKPAVITVEEAQQLKKDFQGIARDAYGKATRQQLNKALAYGQKNAIEEIIPEVKQANRNTQNSLLLYNAIEDAIAKAPGVTPGDVLALILKPQVELTAWLMRHPTVRMSLAVLSDKAGKTTNTLGNAGARVAASQTGRP